MPNEMQDAARASGCNYIAEFKQGLLLPKHPALTAAIDNPSGICWGLAFVWMEYKTKKSHERFFVDIEQVGEKATLLKAAGLYRIVQMKADKLERAAATCGLSPAKDDDGEIKGKHSLRVSDEDDMRTLAKWLSASMGTRYFLIETSGHAMAACGSKTGALEFFDPNFGVVSCWSSNTMAAFFSVFFNHQRIKDNYWKRIPRDLTVHKLKS
ncbi:YopT-type cysteine protease domain-containing protein [Chitinivorax sp. B]|uniref:YopT-type cysteine protease domain-containing protein n=1 Tax=Chitinivorax sp. B TaxID=2502235 RepID=UPI0010F756EA|nr:YopT-type cysteine protease domain-containing protein [Chitinivorax sp. B]